MRTDHIDKYIQAYLDDHLSPKERQRVDAHLAQCSACAQKVADARYLHQELASVFHGALGQPTAPPALRRRVKNALAQQQTTRPFPFNLSWSLPGKLINSAGTVAVVALLAFGAYAVIQGQIPGMSPDVVNQTTLASRSGGAQPTPAPATPTAAAPAQNEQTLGAPRVGASVGDTVSPTKATTPAAQKQLLPTPVPKTAILEKMSMPQAAPSGQTAPNLPGGVIAFPLFDGQMYHTYLINPDGANLRQFKLDGVSEPALHPAKNDYALSVRSWNDPTGPRALVSSDIQAELAQPITHFWEDAQPDWSPTENRIIFASQRESDRRWRLYSAWGDGSLEVNLRREGRAPTFAPDGHRFAFESCDDAGQRCGLWLANLDNSEHHAEPFLLDESAKAPDWSPVAEEIVYMANPNGNWDLYLTSTSSNAEPRRLTADQARDGLPAWSPDGQWVAFVSDRGGQWGLWLLHAASGHLEPVTTFTQGSVEAPNRGPYSQHGERRWWEEQISWGN